MKPAGRQPGHMAGCSRPTSAPWQLITASWESAMNHKKAPPLGRGLVERKRINKSVPLFSSKARGISRPTPLYLLIRKLATARARQVFLGNSGAISSRAAYPTGNGFTSSRGCSTIQRLERKDLAVHIRIDPGTYSDLHLAGCGRFNFGDIC